MGRNHTSIFTPFVGMFEIYVPVNTSRLMSLKLGLYWIIRVCDHWVSGSVGGSYGMASNYKTKRSSALTKELILYVCEYKLNRFTVFFPMSILTLPKIICFINYCLPFLVFILK